MSDIFLNRNEIMFVTRDGEAFKGKWMDGNRPSEKKGQLNSSVLLLTKLKP